MALIPSPTRKPHPKSKSLQVSRVRRDTASMRYRWTGTHFEDRDGKAMDKPFAGQVVMPHVQSDIPEYRSPIDGKPITSRSQRRDDLARNNCVDARDMPSAVPDGFRNKRFAAKRGLTLGEAYR